METLYDSDYQLSVKEALTKLLLQERLIDKKSSLASIDNLSEELNISNIFFGTGISKPNEVSVGIPFDFLIYPLIANKIFKGLGVYDGHIHHLMADNHALLNESDTKKVKRVASNFRKIIENMIDIMDISNYHIYLSSEISTDKTYRKLWEGIQSSNIENDYAKFEAADIEYFRQTRDTIIKLGWKFSGQGNFDEQYFDQAYMRQFGNNIIPIYTVSGKRFNDKMPNTVPYSLYASETETRIIISSDENVLTKIRSLNCSRDTLNMLQNHYNGIVRLFEEATQKIPMNHKTVWEKIQYIINILTH